MAEIELTGGHTTIVDDDDADLANLSWFANETRPGCGRIYALGESGQIYLHRVILERKLGHPIPAGMETDHIDGNGLNNRRCNLRLATKSQNQANRRDCVAREHSSCFRGVSYRVRKKPWRVTIGHEARHIGSFATEEEAARAYDKAAQERWGEFARLNFS